MTFTERLNKLQARLDLVESVLQAQAQLTTKAVKELEEKVDALEKRLEASARPQL
jgi:hypothetical protein